MDKINLFKDALPDSLFRRLGRAVQAVGTERIENMGSYNTTFWFRIGATPTNVVEESITKLYDLVSPGPRCIGMEWWLGRLKFGEALPFHTDRDRSLRHLTGQIVHPLWSSILYLNRFSSSPTVILDQVLSPDGKSWIPPVAKAGRSLDAVPNHYAAFRGDLRHGVVPSRTEKKPFGRPKKNAEYPELRLTLLVNYWDRRPSAPNCQDYDGTVYQAIRNERISPPAKARRLSAA